MAKQGVTVNVEVTEKGLTQTAGKIEAVTKATKNQTKANKEASTAQDELTYKQNQGIVGTSSAARSFSKLNQAIGRGPNGLVGAYASLAANIFAVSAAFYALREAAAVEQILKGLEFQGARTGRSLSLAAEELKVATNNAVSTADALRSTALISSAGFGAEEIQKLGRVATDSALALGRNIPDALERITRGVIKLEPELLDELGLMTKLAEASNRYALENNKTVASLTNFEKRQAFLNAIVEEGTLKFNGISDAIGANPYDKLAATFNDLTQQVLTFVNVFAGAFVKIGGDSTTVLLGTLTLFASMIGRQVLPSLYSLNEAAEKRKATLLAEAAATRKAAAENLLKAKSDQASALASARALPMLKILPKGMKDIESSFKDGSASAEQFNKALKSLDSSIDRRNNNLDKYKDRPETLAVKQQEIKLIQEYRDRLVSINSLEKDHATTVTNSLSSTREARYKNISLIKQAAAQEQAANAIFLAGNGNLIQSFASIGKAKKEYATSLQATARAQAFAGVQATAFSVGLDKLKVGLFTTATAARVAGAAILGALPYIGLIITAYGLAKEAYEKFFKTDAEKKKEKALEDLGKVTDDTIEKLKQLAALQGSLASAAAVTTQKLTAQSNTVVELSDALINASKAILEEQKAIQNGDKVNFLEALFGDSKDVAAWAHNVAKDSKYASIVAGELEKDANITRAAGGISGAISNRITQLLGFGISDETLKTVKGLEQLEKAVGSDLYNAFEKAYGGAEQLVSNPALREEFVTRLKEKYDGLAAAVKELEEAFKQTGDATNAFIQGLGQSTKYDGVLRGLTTVNTALNDLSSFTTAQGVDYNKLLSGIDADVLRLLDEESQKIVQNFKIQETIVKTLEAKKNTIESINGQEVLQLGTAKILLGQYTAQVGKVRESLRAAEDRFVQLQAEERLSKGQIAIINAIVSANQKAYTEGEAGARARIAREEQIRSIQIAQNNLAATQVQLIISSSEATIKLRQQVIKLTESQRENLAKSLEGHELSIRSAQQVVDEQIRSGKLTQEQAKSAKDMIQANLDHVLQLKKNLEDQTQAAKDVRAAQIAIRDAESALTEIRQQNAALSQNELSTEQKLTIFAEQRILQAQRQLEQYNKNKAALDELNRSQENYLDVVSGVAKGPLYEVRELLNGLTRDQQRIVNEGNRDIAETSAAIERFRADQNAATQRGNKLEADGYAEQIKNNQALLEGRKLERDLALSQLEIDTKRKVIEAAIIDIRTDGIEYQQRGLEVLEKEVELRTTAKNQELELYKLRLENSAAKLGGDLSERAQKAIAVKTAQFELQSAQEQLGLRKLGIELEYGLLEAKKVLLEQDIRSRIAILSQEAKLARERGNTTAASYLDTAVEQLTSAFNTLSQRSYTQLKQLALQNEDRTISILQEKAKKAMLDLFNVGRSSNPVEKVLAGIRDAGTVLDAMVGRGADVAKTTLSPAVIAEKNLTESINAEFPKLTEAFNNLSQRLETTKPTQSVIDSSRERLEGRTVTTNPTLEERKRLANEAFDYANSKGFRADELKDRTSVGKHSGIRGTGEVGHYIGTAFDVNLPGFGGKNWEWNNPAAKAKMDELKKYYEDMGATVLWGVKGHFNHMHVEFTRSVRRAQQEISNIADQPVVTSRAAVPETPAAEDIVVANKPGAMSPIASSAAIDLSKINMELETIPITAEMVKVSLTDAFMMASSVMDPYIESLKTLGPEGEAVAAVLSGFQTIGSAIITFTESIEGGKVSLESLASLTSSVLSSVQSITAATSNAKIANIEKEIAAEQKRDGKSQTSLAKIQAMEKKKDDIAKKQFNLNKKLMMAQAVIATAAGIANALATPGPPWVGIAMAALIGAMGAAQLAIIGSTSYESANAGAGTTGMAPKTISIGKRGDSVDLAKGPNANAGGEVGYLRGSQGYGSNASNYNTVGSAYGGPLPRGYGSRGFVVGEKGPEIISPEVPISVTPADEATGGSINATFNINALDSSDVQRVLVNNKGHIIKMLRDAANASGQRFLEDVNVNVYTNPNVSRL